MKDLPMVHGALRFSLSVPSSICSANAAISARASQALQELYHVGRIDGREAASIVDSASASVP